MNKSIKKLAAGATLVFGAFSAFAADPIKIGSVLSVTGPAAFLGDPELKTLQMYVDDIPPTQWRLACQMIVRDEDILVEYPSK